jgi:hypothetical protein
MALWPSFRHTSSDCSCARRRDCLAAEPSCPGSTLWNKRILFCCVWRVKKRTNKRDKTSLLARRFSNHMITHQGSRVITDTDHRSFCWKKVFNSRRVASCQKITGNGKSKALIEKALAYNNYSFYNCQYNWVWLTVTVLDVIAKHSSPFLFHLSNISGVF